MGEGAQLLTFSVLFTVLYTLGALVYGLARLAVTEAPAIVALLCACAIALIAMARA